MASTAGTAADPRSPARFAAAHPVVTVGALGTIAAVAHAIWFAHVRHLGTLNIDEAGYLANALFDHRGISWNIVDTARAMSTTTTGPLVPIGSVVPLLLGPRTVTAAWMVQPILYVLVAVAVAGLTRRLSGSRASVVAGVVALCLPGAIQATRSYQFAPAVAVCLVAAMWALVASDRGSRTWRMVAFGAAVGALLLARTMTVGFLPALVLAVVLVVRWDRRGVRNTAFAALAAAAVAGPWWYIAWGPVSEYLLGFGYGGKAADYGPGALSDRFGARYDSVRADVQVPYLLLLVATALLVLAARPRSIRVRPRPLLTDRRRDFLAVVGVVVVGTAALLSTSNRGIWFELPLEQLAITPVVAAAATLRPRARRTLARVAVAIGALTLVVSLTDRGGRIDDLRQSVFRGLERDQPLTTRADISFASNDPEVRARAADRWWSASAQIVDWLEAQRRRSGSTAIRVTVNGSSVLVNSQTVRLAEELAGTDIGPLDNPDTSDPAGSFDESLTATPDGMMRVLVIIDTELEPFPPDVGRDRFERQARAAGWIEDEVIGLPDGGEVRLLVAGAGGTGQVR